MRVLGAREGEQAVHLLAVHPVVAPVGELHHRHGAGRSIAVQNFNENASILAMIALYSLMLALGLSIYTVIVLFGLFVAGTMTLVQAWYNHNRRAHAEEVERLLAFARAESPHH